MKAKEIIKLLEANPEADLIFWDGNDNFDVENIELDVINKSEIVISV